MAVNDLLEQQAAFAAGFELGPPARQVMPGGLDQRGTLTKHRVAPLQLVHRVAKSLLERCAGPVAAGCGFDETSEGFVGGCHRGAATIGESAGFVGPHRGSLGLRFDAAQEPFEVGHARRLVGEPLPERRQRLVRPGGCLVAGGQIGLDPLVLHRRGIGPGVGVCQRRGGHPLPADDCLQFVRDTPDVDIELAVALTQQCDRRFRRGRGASVLRIAAVQCRELRFEVLVPFCEARDLRSRGRRCRLGRDESGGEIGQPSLDGADERVGRAQVGGGGRHAQQPQPIGHLPPPPGAGGLVFHGFQPCGDFTHDVGEPLTVLLGTLQPPERLGATNTESCDAGGLLEDGAAIPARGDEQRVDAALLDHAVGLRRRTRSGEQLADVAEARDGTVDEVFAFAAAVHPPGDLHVVGVERQLAGRIVEHERRLGGVERLARDRSGENHVGHVAAAQAADRLLAQHPLEGVDDVGFARTVRPDDDRDALGKLEAGPVGEALEAEQFERFEPGHEDSSVRLLREPDGAVSAVSLSRGTSRS